MSGVYYMLNPRTLQPVQVAEGDWNNAFGEVDPRLARTVFELPTGDNVIVSTVFTGLETESGMFFSTAIINSYAAGFEHGDEDEWQFRTALGAAKGHRAACKLVAERFQRANLTVKRRTEWPAIGQ